MDNNKEFKKISKQERQKLILNVIGSNQLKDLEEIKTKLNDKGIEASIPSLSRDTNDLSISKDDRGFFTIGEDTINEIKKNVLSQILKLSNCSVSNPKLFAKAIPEESESEHNPDPESEHKEVNYYCLILRMDRGYEQVILELLDSVYTKSVSGFIPGFKCLTILTTSLPKAKKIHKLLISCKKN
jgi:arginine repressor